MQPKIAVENITPVGDRMLISVFKGANKIGGLELAETKGQATPVIGTVIKAGDGVPYKEGDMVFFRRYAVDEIKVDAIEDQELYFLEASEVIATYNGEKKVDARSERYSKIEEKKAGKEEKAEKKEEPSEEELKK